MAEATAGRLRRLAEELEESGLRLEATLILTALGTRQLRTNVIFLVPLVHS